MFQELIMENVRKPGQLRYNFDKDLPNYLRGPNGAGKSTVCEALTFSLTGRDTAGNPLPTHLICRGQSGLKTAVMLYGGWSVSRTLTQKKNTTINVCGPSGVEFKVSQQQLFEVLGMPEIPVEAYLAATLPGYFMALPSPKRFTLLSSILPKFDRARFVAEVSGFTEDDVIKMCGGFARGIPNWHNFSHHRVDLQKRKAKTEGRIEEIRRHQSTPAEPPKEPFAVKLLPILQQHIEETNKYTSDMQSYMRIKHQHDYCVLEEQRRENAMTDVNKRLEELVIFEPIFDVSSYEALIQELRSQVRSTPETPSVMDLPETDMCSSCGQVVGSLLREKIAKENKEKIEEYRRKEAEVHNHNAPLVGEIKSLLEKVSELQKKNSEIKARSATSWQMGEMLRKQQEELTTLPALIKPELPPVPVKPLTPPDLIRHNAGPYKKDLLALQDEIDLYTKRVGVYEKQLRDAREGEIMIAELEKEILALDSSIVKYEKFEYALRVLPQEEVVSQRSTIRLENYEMDFSEGFDIVHKNGTPYECLSSGEKIQLDVGLCSKFQSLMNPAPGWCFVDDADLVHDLSAVRMQEGIQMFFAQVREGQNTAEVVLEFSLGDSQ